jgi:hypothetical protein
MAARRAFKIPLNKSDIQLAISSLNANQIQSKQRAAAIFNVAKLTLHNQRAGKPA